MAIVSINMNSYRTSCHNPEHLHLAITGKPYDFWRVVQLAKKYLPAHHKICQLESHHSYFAQNLNSNNHMTFHVRLHLSGMVGRPIFRRLINRAIYQKLAK
jgi:hypothetical protein